MVNMAKRGKIGPIRVSKISKRGKCDHIGVNMAKKGVNRANKGKYGLKGVIMPK